MSSMNTEEQKEVVRILPEPLVLFSSRDEVAGRRAGEDMKPCPGCR
jgi:hypothetical protein